MPWFSSFFFVCKLSYHTPENPPFYSPNKRFGDKAMSLASVHGVSHHPSRKILVSALEYGSEYFELV